MKPVTQITRPLTTGEAPTPTPLKIFERLQLLLELKQKYYKMGNEVQVPSVH